MKATPFVEPKVEHATPTGTIQAKDPKTFAPKVVATALKSWLDKIPVSQLTGFAIARWET